MSIITQFALIVYLSVSIAACSFFEIKKLDIVQGNIVTQISYEKLKKGLSVEEVIKLLGSPLIQDAFHKDRLDYVYRLQNGENLKTQYRLSLYFKEDKLERWEKTGDQLPEK